MGLTLRHGKCMLDRKPSQARRLPVKTYYRVTARHVRWIEILVEVPRSSLLIINVRLEGLEEYIYLAATWRASD